MYYQLFLLSFLGLCLGSFVNAWLWRFSQNESPQRVKHGQLSVLHGRSICPNCKHTLQWYDLVPLFSWFMLKRKCRYCHTPISWQYPLVELLTALLFVVSFVYWPLLLTSVFSIIFFLLWLLFLVVLVALAVYDGQHMLLPNQIIAVGWVMTILAVVVSLGVNGAPALYDMVVGSVVFGGLFYVLFQASSGRWIGGGDVKLGFLLGVWLAGVVPVFLTIFLASILGLILVALTSLFKSVSVKDHIPFGPMLISATVIIVLFFNEIHAAFLGNLLVI